MVKKGYNGPRPPENEEHIFFRIYALDFTVRSKKWSSKDQFLGAVQGHILNKGELMEVYKR